MFNFGRQRASRRLGLISSSAGLLVLFGGLGPADAAVNYAQTSSSGCGTYSEPVSSCPGQQQVDAVCEQHAGGCVIEEAKCSTFGVDEIHCEYTNAL